MTCRSLVSSVLICFDTCCVLSLLSSANGANERYTHSSGGGEGLHLCCILPPSQHGLVSVMYLSP